MVKEYTAKARKMFYKEWRPWTLTDESRAIYHPPGYMLDRGGWLNEVREMGCFLDRQRYQKKHVIIAYEARAMHQQFLKYTAPFGVPLVPLGGDPSVPYKWKILQHIVKAAEHWKVPSVILYFGDYDPKGEQIPNTVKDDITMWFQRQGLENVEKAFTWERVGLNKGDGERYGIPVRPDKPTQYQWEALSDEQARKLIEMSISNHTDTELLLRAISEEQKLGEEYKRHMKGWYPSQVFHL